MKYMQNYLLYKGHMRLNMGIWKLSYTLKEVAPPEWLLDEEASFVGSFRRI